MYCELCAVEHDEPTREISDLMNAPACPCGRRHADGTALGARYIVMRPIIIPPARVDDRGDGRPSTSFGVYEPSEAAEAVAELRRRMLAELGAERDQERAAGLTRVGEDRLVVAGPPTPREVMSTPVETVLPPVADAGFARALLKAAADTIRAATGKWDQ